MSLPRISQAEKDRRANYARARVALDNVWSDFGLTTLEFIELLTESAHSITARHRQRSEADLWTDPPAPATIKVSDL